ncbi:hypothetical protein ABZV78_11770 [Micromonospora sp. NPDC004540]|uniref:hypothetical protein n=1 Tax=Micromonospora sp. NPDC004540 TaxID=3154457 RepID=UPI0033B37915
MITPAPVELLTRFPALAPLGRPAARLNPRPGAVTAADSHLGGPLRWPAAETWPTCDTPHMVAEEVPLPAELLARLREREAHRTQAHVMADGELELLEEIARLVGPGYTGFGSVNGGPYVGHRYVARPHPTPNPMVALAQLRAADLPDLPRPDGADLLQVLWCPFEHQQATTWGPTVHLRWRREAEVTDPLAAPPEGEVGDEHYLPRPCRLHPERVVDYPDPAELPAAIRDALPRAADEDEDDDDEDVAEFYDRWPLAFGWKVGGHPFWTLTDPTPTPCPSCAGPTRLVLTIDSTRETTGVVVGRYGALRVFACLACPGTPVVLNQQ